MINTIYRLVAPRRFEIAFEDIELFGENAIVRPTYLSICNADMRYYLGTRDAKVLAEKLPMALIHEGVGEVFFDPTNTFKPGDKVVIIDDLLATGGTTKAMVNLVEKLGGQVVRIVCLIELCGLKGRDLVPGYSVETVAQYPGA